MCGKAVSGDPGSVSGPGAWSQVDPRRELGVEEKAAGVAPRGPRVMGQEEEKEQGGRRPGARAVRGQDGGG